MKPLDFNIHPSPFFSPSLASWTSATTFLPQRYRLRRVSGIPNHVVAVGNGAATIRRDNTGRTASQRRSNQNQYTCAARLA